jgi:hypothetical protein
VSFLFQRLWKRPPEPHEPEIIRDVWFGSGGASKILFDQQKMYLGPYGEIELRFEGNLDLSIHSALDDGFQPHRRHLRYPVHFVTDFYSPPSITFLRRKSQPKCEIRARDISRKGFRLEILVPPREAALRKLHVSWRATGTPATQVSLAKDNVPVELETLSPCTEFPPSNAKGVCHHE